MPKKISYKDYEILLECAALLNNILSGEASLERIDESRFIEHLNNDLSDEVFTEVMEEAEKTENSSELKGSG